MAWETRAMRVFISVDIEGVAGISHWDEAFKSKEDYGRFQRQMTAEAVAACSGALDAGATAITVKDAHGSGRNLSGADLPQPAELISGWSGHPFSMVQGLDDTYDAVAFVGYHAKAGDGGNPLAHTMSGRLHRMKLNGQPVAEYHIYANAAALVGVPVVFVAGDRTICSDVESNQPATSTFTTKWGEGSAQHSVHPDSAVEGIQAGLAEALRGDVAAARLELPDHFVLDLEYSKAHTAYEMSFFPGMTQVDTTTIRLETDDYFEVLRAVQFVM